MLEVVHERRNQVGVDLAPKGAVSAWPWGGGVGPHAISGAGAVGGGSPGSCRDSRACPDWGRHLRHEAPPDEAPRPTRATLPAATRWNSACRNSACQVVILAGQRHQSFRRRAQRYCSQIPLSMWISVREIRHAQVGFDRRYCNGRRCAFRCTHFCSLDGRKDTVRVARQGEGGGWKAFNARECRWRPSEAFKAGGTPVRGGCHLPPLLLTSV